MTPLPLSLAYLEAQLIRRLLNTNDLPPRTLLDKIEGVLLLLPPSNFSESPSDIALRDFVFKTHALTIEACKDLSFKINA